MNACYDCFKRISLFLGGSSNFFGFSCIFLEFFKVKFIKKFSDEPKVIYLSLKPSLILNMISIASLGYSHLQKEIWIY